MRVASARGPPTCCEVERGSAASGLCLRLAALASTDSRVCGVRVRPPTGCGPERGRVTDALCNTPQVLLAAGDTYRAAAAEQLAGWAERSGAAIATVSSERQRPDALLYSALDRVRARRAARVCARGAGTCRARVQAERRPLQMHLRDWEPGAGEAMPASLRTGWRVPCSCCTCRVPASARSGARAALLMKDSAIRWPATCRAWGAASCLLQSNRRPAEPPRAWWYANRTGMRSARRR